jgi:hypothetical protein
MKFVHICLLSSVLFVSGCSSFTQPAPEPCEPYELPKLQVPNPEPIDMKPVEFTVINKSNAQKEFSALEQKGIDPVVWGLTDDNYKAMALNIEQLQAYIMKQHDIIEAYRQYYEETFNGEDLSAK